MYDEAAIGRVYAEIGDAGFQRLIAAFYRRIPTDDLLGPLYPADDLAGAEHRLRSFLIFRFGGPQHYLRDRGQPQLRMRHVPFAIDLKVRDRWVKLMDEALDEVNLPPESASVIRPFLHDVATFLINRDSKPGITL